MRGPILLRVNATNDVVGVDPSRNEFEIRWPPGYRAVFDPDFEGVIDEAGNVVARANQDLIATSTGFGKYLVCLNGAQAPIDVWPLPAH
jgi:hypothetical protein